MNLRISARSQSRGSIVSPAFSVLLLMAVIWSAIGLEAQKTSGHLRPSMQKQRLIVLTDIGAEADDTESMVRLVLYSDDIDIEGLVATTSTWKRTSVSPDLIQNVIDAYGKVHGNLLQHDSAYPTAAALRALVKRGRPEYGMGGVGEGKDSQDRNGSFVLSRRRMTARSGSQSGEEGTRLLRPCTRCGRPGQRKTLTA